METELKQINKELYDFSLKIKKTKEEKCAETKLWNKKRRILAQLNSLNKENQYE